MNRSKTTGIRKPAHYGSVASVGAGAVGGTCSGSSGGVQAERESGGNGPASPAPSLSTIHSIRRERSSYMFGLPNDLANFSSDQLSSARILVQRWQQQQQQGTGSLSSVDARRSTVGSYDSLVSNAKRTQSVDVDVGGPKTPGPLHQSTGTGVAPATAVVAVGGGGGGADTPTGSLTSTYCSYAFNLSASSSERPSVESATVLRDVAEQLKRALHLGDAALIQRIITTYRHHFPLVDSANPTPVMPDMSASTAKNSISRLDSITSNQTITDLARSRLRVLRASATSEVHCR